MIDIVNLTLTEGWLYYVGQFIIMINTKNWLFIYFHKIALRYWLLYYIEILLYFFIFINLIY